MKSARKRRGLVVDLFAGGGGASTGLEAALGRPVDVAINHSATALAVHAANHPGTRHLTADIWEVKPEDVTQGRPVDVLWASPDCTHFSVAKGGKPRQKNIRSLAEVVVEWAQAVRPRCIFVENVREFQGWGPLDEEGYPDEARKGELFARWVGRLQLMGYAVEWRVLDASLFGAPTSRKRLFIVARCDGQPIRWPTPTHGPGRQPMRTAAECIDWARPCPSIFLTKEEGEAIGVKRPLVEKTLRRIAHGLRRFVFENPDPFFVPEPFIIGCGGRAGQTPPTGVSGCVGTITAKNDRSLVVPTLVQTGYGERNGQSPRALDLHQPLGTVVAGGQKHALVAAFLAKHYGGVVGQKVDQPASTITATAHHALTAATLVQFNGECAGRDVAAPMPTITAGGHHLAEVRAFLMTYYGNDASGGQELSEPMRTITAKHRLGLVTVHGVDYQVVDIGMRMLEPDPELLRAQFGRFADAYDLSAATSKEAKCRLIGNSVCPEAAEALARANLGGVEQRAAA